MNAPSPAAWQEAAAHYGVALLVVIVAALVRWALQPVMGVAPPYITFYLAIVVAAALGGFGPGVFATVVGGLLGVGIATLPVDKLALGTPAEQVRLFIYLVSGVAISLIAAAMHNARRRAANEAEELRKTTEALRVANERLLEADRSKDRFLAILSHELRNPLMPIKHSLYVLENSPSDGETARQARTIVDRQVDQLTRVVNDLLDMSRITREKLTLQRERLDLGRLVSRTLDDHRAVFMMRGIPLLWSAPPQPVWICGDAGRLSQVLGNLLHNAAKFTRTGGEVRVSLGQEGEQAVLRVRDNGVGISPELLQHIFDPFAQAGEKTDHAGGGLGLGLALVKWLVDLHDGSVEAHSEGLGMGAEFTLRLPLDMRLVQETAPRAPAPPRSRRRVLIVEDNLDSADTLSTLLRINGHEVEISSSGSQAIEKARAFRPDTVLCDIGLPDIDGYEVARALRTDALVKDAQLIALTGYATIEDREKALAAGFDKHLVKPPAVDDLERALNDSPRDATAAR